MKKVIGVLCSGLLAAGLLSACGSGAPSSSASQASPAAASSSQAPAASSDSAPPEEASPVNKEGFPIVNEPITLKIFGQTHPMHVDWSEMDVFIAYQEMTGINLEFELAPTQGYDEKKNLLFAGGDYPDMFVRAQLNNTELVKYGGAGVLLPLGDLIAEWAPNYAGHLAEYPAIRTRITAPDGGIYALSDVVTQTAARTEKFWMNKDWLEAVGKGVPATVEELEDVLRAFKTLDYDQNGQNDEIPMGARDLNSIINNMIGMWGEQYQFDQKFSVSQDGTVGTWITSDSLKGLLQWANRMFAEGLIDPELFTQDQAKWNAKMSGQKVGFFFNQADDMFDPASFVGVAPMSGMSDTIYVKSSPVGRGNGVFAISTSCRYPEAAMRWVDYFYGEEGSIFLRFGVEGKTWNRGPDGKPEYVDGILDSPDGSGAAISKFTIWPGGGAPQWINLDNSIAVASETTVAAQQALEPHIPENIYPAPIFDQATNDRLLILDGDIKKYYEESTAKFVKGDLGFDNWDTYVETLEKMGVNEWVEIYQKALDSTK